MNIQFEKTSNVAAEMTITSEKAEYQERVEKALKDYRKKAALPGFRPGQVPLSLMKKRFGGEITAEEVQKLLSEKLYDYLRENKVNMLGDPLASEKQPPVDFEAEKLDFIFDIALAPEFDATLSAKDKVPYYTIDVTDEMVDGQVKAYAQRGGNYVKVDTWQTGDMTKGHMAELDDDGNIKEGGIVKEDAVMLPEYFKNEDQKKLFNGAKVNDIIKFNPSVAYDGSETELSSLLKINKEQVAEHKGDFNFQITEITRFVLGDLNEELFEQVYPGAGIKTEEEFKQKISDSITEQFKKDSDYRFIIDVRNYLTKKLGKLEFPEEKLKKLMLANAKGDQKKVDENYDKSIEELTWHLIKEQLVEMTQTKVEDKDVKDMAKEVTRMQFAQYGMFNIPDEYLESSVTEMLKKRETVDNLIDRCIELKLSTALKSMVTLNNKNVTPEEFNELFKD